MIPETWNETEARDLSQEILSLGRHICEIIDLSNYTTKDGKAALRVIYDIKEGSKYDRYCQKLLDNRTTDDKRWPNEGTKYFSLNEKSLGYFKYFVQVLEKSNNRFLNITPGEELDCTQFKGMKFVGVFGLQEYRNNDGELKTSIYLALIKEVNKVNEITIPDVRLEDGTYIPYEEYAKNKKGVGKQEHVQEKMNFEEEDTHKIYDAGIEAEDLPF